MIYSMTAFGRSQTKSDWGMAIWEMRSINHRYLEMSIRIPDILRELEQNIREIVHQNFQRGKLECILRFYPGPKLSTEVSVNHNLLEQLISLSTDISEKLPEKITRLNVTDLLRWNGVIAEESFDINSIREPLLNLFKEAAEDLKQGRAREGEVLAEGILSRLKKISKEIQVIKKQLPKVMERQREKITQRLEEAKINLDPQRLEQEMVYFTQKIDISEEVERTLSHIEEVKRTLLKRDSAGKRLDFMMQELNREANTLASKSVDIEVTHAAVEMKVLIEQIREQVQNIE